MYMESRKMVPMNLFTQQQWRYIENRLYGQMQREEGDGGRYGESNMEIYITKCKIDSQWEFVVRLRELKLGLCNNLEGWDWEGCWRDVQVRRDMDKPMADSC